MDFPDDITTNVFRVADTKEIYWAFYSKRTKDESALQGPPSSEEKDALATLLQLSEYILREDGRHVLYDKYKAGVWIFSLSQTLDERIVETLGLDGLEPISVGSIRSGDLVSAIDSKGSAPPAAKTARSAQTNSQAIEELNTQAYGSNSTPDIQPSIGESIHKAGEAWSANQDHSISEVYSNLISALSRSLAHALGKERGWIQAGPSVCIDERTLGDDLFDNIEPNSWIATTTQLSFDIKWLASGTMLISFFRIRLPRYIMMSNILGRDAQSTELAVGSPLLLSPSGIRCQYLGTEKHANNDVRRKSNAQMKASILSYLACQGITTVQDAIWVQVQMGSELRGTGVPPVSLWPADLCFCEDMSIPVSSEDGGLLTSSILDGTTDPLEQAETWFLGRSARMQALRARVQEQNREAQALKDVENTDDEEDLSPFEIPMDQGITPQDVSGIYPTPPDGLPPALLGLSNLNNPQSGDFDEEEKEPKPSDEGRGDYDGQENDDLFEDMDIDMFASNGLTEADFSFFDEPGMIDEDLRETGQVMALHDMHETTDPSTAFVGQESTAMLHGKGVTVSNRNVAEDQGDVIDVQGSDQIVATTGKILPGKDCNKGFDSTVEIDDVSYGVLEQLNLHHGAKFQDADGDQRRSFEHVPFQKSTFSIDDKYNMQGRFAFDVDELPIPKNGHRSSHPDMDFSAFSACPEESTEEDTDYEEEGEPSPEDSDIHDAMNPSLGLQAGLSRKRKREQLDENDHLVTPSSSVPLAESLEGSPQNKVDEHVSDLSKANTFDRTKSMIELEARSLGILGPSFTGQGSALVEVAQMVASQAVSGFLKSQTDNADEEHLSGQSIVDQSLQSTISKVLLAFFPTNKRCSLKEYASLGEKNSASLARDHVASNQRSLKPAYMAGGLQATGQSIFKLESPYTRVRRNGISTEISATALSFWEELSLGPSHETKDIDAFCLCPKSKFIEEGVMAFLNMIKGAYQSCNLGSHDLGASPADYSKRLITIPIDTREPDKFLQDIGATCEGLGTKLEEVGLRSSTIVIYIINPFKDQHYLPGLCDALLRLPNSYRAALEKKRPERQNNIVLQIVPLDLVWSPEYIVVSSPADYRRLAFEIYNQCGSANSGHTRESDFMRAPAIRLSKAVPKTIDFKLVSESSAPLTESDNCLHVSYTWDASSEWLAAIWTDNLGVLSWRACYCLGKNEKPWTTFYEVVKEILETSFEMLHPPNALWHLFVCKDSPILKGENEAWLRAIADSSRPSISCAILTIDAKPSLSFAYSDLHRSSSDIAPGLLATPGATPQTNAPSPDISGFGSTPAGSAAQVGTPPPNVAPLDYDSEARLIDITDETWGVVMDGPLDDHITLSNQCPSIASGYLVKRAGSRNEDGLITLSVKLVHGQKPYRSVLKEVLGMYRNLGTLARVRGVVHPVKSILPLHVAAARNAWKAVSRTMRREPE